MRLIYKMHRRKLNSNHSHRVRMTDINSNQSGRVLQPILSIFEFLKNLYFHFFTNVFLTNLDDNNYMEGFRVRQESLNEKPPAYDTLAKI
jgi:hypothetical protein